MSALVAHRLAVRQQADVRRVDLRVAKRWPTMRDALSPELGPCTTNRRTEQRVARDRIVEVDRRVIAFGFSRLGRAEKRSLLKVAAVFGVMPIEAADSVGRLRT